MIGSKLKPIKLFSFVLKTVFYILICLLFLNCEETILEFDEKTFYREWAAWEALAIADYSVKIKLDIHEPFPGSFYYRIIVRENISIEVESLDGYDYNPPHLMLNISGCFNLIESLSKTCKNSRGYIRLTYNEEYHYPEIIDFDLPEGGRSGLGAETRYLSEFTKLTSEIEE